jgi:hypothetical protein
MGAGDPRHRGDNRLTHNTLQATFTEPPSNR